LHDIYVKAFTMPLCDVSYYKCSGHFSGEWPINTLSIKEMDTGDSSA